MRWQVGVAAVAVILAGCASAAGSAQDSGHRPPRVSRLVVHGDSETATSVPSCSWPVRVFGRASSAQLGLIRCYLRALADRSLRELAPLVRVVAEDPVTLTRADLRHALDASRGTATLSFWVNYSDPFNATVDIVYADGARSSLDMDAMNVKVPASKSWRLSLGSTRPDPSGPPPAMPDGPTTASGS